MTQLQPQILWEDNDLVVLDKPAGLVVHGDGRTQESTLADWILEYYPKLENVGEPFEFKVPGGGGQTISVPRPGIVHRLDRDTSGVMVLAKTQEAFNYLKTEFREHRVKKEYLALVYGHLDTESGIIDAPIGKSKQDFRQRDATSEAGGTMREARTIWEMKKRLTDSEGHKFSLLLIRPETGRTHQIRAHMKALGYQIVCDSLYARGRLCPPPLARHGLHASRLSLTLPSGETKIFETPLPADFRSALDALRPM